MKKQIRFKNKWMNKMVGSILDQARKLSKNEYYLINLWVYEKKMHFKNDRSKAVFCFAL